MNDNFWTLIKIVVAVGATLLVYKFLDSGSSVEIKNFSLIDISIEKLGEILSASIEDNDARREAKLEFKEFSDLVMEGEIAPDEIEDIASSILNMRMRKNPDISKSTKEIIRALKRARATSSFIEESPEELAVILDSIAVKINNLTIFQEEYYQRFLHSEYLTDLKVSAETPGLIESDKIQVVIDFDPVVIVSPTPQIANLRKKSEIVIIGETLVDIPPIQITENLNILIDYTKLNMMDSLTVSEFHKKMNELKSIKLIINHIQEKNKEKSVNSNSE
ncbi:MAG: hypothetical protein IIB39_08725 [Candidatus Marinimicrobia bacterium]|nr:hypothetical protein [Candidatus Neomarinimicrobiota bacterium]